MKFNLVPIIKTDSIKVNEIVYDLEVENNHSYCVTNNCIVVHNSACKTTQITGIGYPQLSAIIECADTVHGVKGHICSDGGIREIGDICKAFGAGADFVMLGGFFAGHDECSGKWIKIPEIIIDENTNTGPFVKSTGKKIKSEFEYYGMSSETAMNKYSGGKSNYRASEGKTIRVPYKGPISKTCEEILGGLRSACTYINCTELKDFSKCCTFIRV